MEYTRTSNSHSIIMDDEEIGQLVSALNSCNLTERRTFNKLLRHIKDGKDLCSDKG